MLNIIILFNSEKHKIEIETSKDINYTDLYNQIKTLINYDQTIGELKLMTTDTFTLFDESSYKEIITQCIDEQSNDHTNNFTLELQANIIDNNFISNIIESKPQIIINKNQTSITSEQIEYPSQIKNKVEESNILLNFKESMHPQEPKRIFTSEYCDICTEELITEKYICCICDNLTICARCESGHPHSTFKFKVNFLANLKDIYTYIKKYNYEPAKKKLFASSKKEIDLKLEIQIEKHISIRPNKMHKIPFLLINNSKYTIHSQDLNLFIRNYKYLNFYFEFGNEMKILPKNSIGLNVLCQSKYVLGQENVVIELYSQKYSIKDLNKKACVHLIIDVNSDAGDMELTDLFYSYEKIQMLKKEYKEMILYIMKEGLSNKAPLEIYDSLRRNNWNMEVAMNELIE